MSCIRPDWPAPETVVAFSTTRAGGCSEGRFAGLNLGDHVGDDRAKVINNRAVFAKRLPAGTAVQWLTQDHGTNVVVAGDTESQPVADGSWSNQPGVACTVMTADCLPVLLCTRDGDAVAAIHAGWRGLSAGILERSIAAMGVPPQSLMAWMGPAIGPTAFEVGAEVRQKFIEQDHDISRQLLEQCFMPVSGSADHFFADLYHLAELRMKTVGVVDVYGGKYCTYRDRERFYSFRRDGQTGRMATTITIKP